MANPKKTGPEVHPHLTILEDISTLITHSHDLQDTLQNIVTTVRDRMEAEVCSIYILDPQKKRLTLRATMGLDSESIGKVSMAIGEGLTGLVIERMEPVFPRNGRRAFSLFLGRAAVRQQIAAWRARRSNLAATPVLAR
jgi:transcriptional regulator with GAF, ATPase, and Fis domain